MPIPEAASSASRPPVSTSSSTPALPPAANSDLSGLRLLEVVFRTQLNVNRLDDLYATTRGTVSSLSVVSNCDLGVLKAFVAKSWAPVVLLHSSGRRLWAVTGYDDAKQEILVENAVSRIVRPLTYSEFQKDWATSSGSKCVLITPGKLNRARVHSVLTEYLPPQRVAQVQVRSR